MWRKWARDNAWVTTLYAPRSDGIRAVAKRAALRNSHPDARGWLLTKVDRPPDDWDSRSFFTVPGLVWNVSSDTCMTGHLSAPENIAYDDYGREFVFRQPENEEQLARIMSADSEEVFECYRFNGLDRWTLPAFDAWLSDHHALIAWASHVQNVGTEDLIVDSAKRYRDYLDSSEFENYVVRFSRLLKAKSPPGPTMRRGTRC